ncbi:ankyrin repeat domain-containing protein SOWAHA [Neosynchiropus ocellatus]
MALTQESILSFLLDRGGKVKNSDLVNHFRGHIHSGDPAEKQHNRELFKTLVNSVAVVRTVDQVTFVVVKKRYQDFVKEHDAGQEPRLRLPSPPRTDGMLSSDLENNNCPSRMNGNLCRQMSAHSVRNDPDTTLKVLNISGDRAKRKSGPVFAVIAVKSPPKLPAQQDGTAPSSDINKLPSISNLNVVSSFKASLCLDSSSVPEEKPLTKTTRLGEDVCPESVPLDPQAHEWLVKCAGGLWGQVSRLLQQDPRLAQKRDFISGFTALHWAAKSGNSQMIQKLVDISRKSGSCININSRAHGGYTPLHIAAIHGHSGVMLLLVRRYGANVNTRDNDGKKACHYLRKGASAEVRALLGGLLHGKKTEDELCREQHKGFNTISKLFQPHTNRKQKYSARFAHDW